MRSRHVTSRSGSLPTWLATVLVGVVVLLAGCRLDVDTTATVNLDGSGEIVVAARADAGVVAQAPGLAESLQFDDAVNSGWTVDGPTGADGGLQVTLRHPFSTAEEATGLFASLGPPFTAVTITRSETVTEPGAEPDEVSFVLAGSLALPGGTFDAFSDAELTGALGAVPFAAQVQAAGATPASSMSIDLTIDLPGAVVATTGNQSDGSISWSAPLDGSAVDLSTQTVVRADPGGSGLWGTVATAALVLLIVWSALWIGVAALRYRATRR